MKGRGIRDMEGNGREGCDYRRTTWRNSLVVWWLGLSALTAKGPGSIPLGKLRSHKPCGQLKKKLEQQYEWSLWCQTRTYYTQTHTQVHVKLRKSEQDQWVVLMSIFWLWYCTTVYQNATVGEAAQFPSDLPILFLKITNKSIIISTKILIKKILCSAPKFL